MQPEKLEKLCSKVREIIEFVLQSSNTSMVYSSFLKLLPNETMLNMMQGFAAEGVESTVTKLMALGQLDESFRMYLTENVEWIVRKLNKLQERTADQVKEEWLRRKQLPPE